MRNYQWCLAAVGLAVLAACGGGGTDTAADSTGRVLRLSSANYIGAAHEAMSSTHTLQATAPFVLGVEAVYANPALQFARAQLSRLAVSAAAVQDQACPGYGSMRTTFDDKNSNGRLDAGDGLTITASNCVFGGGPMSGSLAISVRSVTMDPANASVHAIRAGVVFTQLSDDIPSGSTVLNGSVEMDIQSRGSNDRTETLVTGAGLVASGQFGGVAFSRVLSNYTTTTTFAPTASGYTEASGGQGVLASSSFGQQPYEVRTLVPFVRTHQQFYPTVGQAILTGAGGSQVRVTVQSATQVLVELDADGDGLFETFSVQPWSSLL